MNKTEHIMGILGIEKNKPFYIGRDVNTIYTYDGERLTCNDLFAPIPTMLYALIFMSDEYYVHPIAEPDWRPGIDEYYWYLNPLGQPIPNINSNSLYDIDVFNHNNVFKTEAEAKSNGGKVDE